MSDPQPPRRARHLMDPDRPRSAPRPGAMSTDRVQKWILSALALTTILHLSVGLVIAAAFVDDSRRDAQLGINAVAAAFGVIAIAAARAIHAKHWASPWLLLGVLPGVVGVWICYS